MAKKMKITTIQLQEETRKLLEGKKVHQRESYDSVVRRMLEEEDFPSLEEMFKRAKRLKHRKYATEEIVKLSHELRNDD